METGISNLLNWIDETSSKVSLSDYAKDECDMVKIGDTFVGYSPFDSLSHDNYLDRRLMVYNNAFICLSTGKTGDILDYIMATKKLNFKEALLELASVANVEAPDLSSEIDERVKANAHKERLYALMRDTMLHYFNNLKDDRAKIAVDYLEKRGFENVLTVDASGKKSITNDIVCTFALGFSLDEYALVNAMTAKGYTLEEMDECGLVYLKNGKAYDVMAGRLIIPILNRHNKVIAFSGRIFEAKGHQKYRNTGNTTLFSKKNEIYGANNLPALSHQGKLNEVFVVEGYMDVISLYKEGIKNAVASMGTALTSDHARILKNYSENIYLTYDGDNAGQDAIRRGLDVLYAEGISAKVITLPGGQDPDEIIKAHGVMYFLELKHNARSMIEFKVDDLANKYNLDEADDRGEYAVKAIELLLKYVGKVDGEELLDRISEKSGISREVLYQEMYNSNIEKLSSGDNRESRPLTPKERALVYILYDMLKSKEHKDIAAFLDNKEERIAYNYMRLMGSGASEEEFGEVLNSDIATNVSTLKSMDKDMLSRASRDSYNTMMKEFTDGVRSRIVSEFKKTTDPESRLILNQCLMSLLALSKKHMTIK